MKRGKNKQDWRTRTKGTSKQVGTHYPLEPHGDKSKLPKGGLVVVTPPVARRLELAWVKTKNIPKTEYRNKKDNERIAEFMDMIQRGIPLAPPVIHILPNGEYEVIDGKHKVEAYRRLGYKKFPATMNATIAEIARALGDDYEEFLHMQPRKFSEKRDLARRAITAQRGSPLVTEDTAGAFDALNPLSSGDTQVEEIIAGRQRNVVKSGDLVTGKRRNGLEFRTRTVGTDAQIGTHFPVEPHGDKTALPKELSVVSAPPSFPTAKQAKKTVESEDVKEKLAELDKKLKESEAEKKNLAKELAKAKEETPEQKADREHREKALIIAQDRSAKMRARREKARIKAEAEKERNKLFGKAKKSGVKAGIELADRVFPKMEAKTLESAKEYVAEAQLIERQANRRKRSTR